jgi:molybdenum cofactor guanylyltransferase
MAGIASKKITKKDITAVILAGGRGSRLAGQDKGLVSYKNKSLIEHVIERIQPQVSTIIVNANRNQASYAKYGYSITSDKMSDFQGPLAGFVSAMRSVKTDYIVTMPCDGPSLPLDLVSRMIENLNSFGDTSNSIAVAHDGEWLQPVHALIPIALVDSLEDFLAKGDRKVDLWYNKHNLVLVDFSDQPNAFFNINKEEQLGRK